MSVRIIHDEEQGLACLYQSETDVAFGPVFYADSGGGYSGLQLAEKFVKWADLRNSRLWLFRKDEEIFDKYHEFMRLDWKECPECSDDIVPHAVEACDKCLHECHVCGDDGVDTKKMTEAGPHKGMRLCSDCEIKSTSAA